MICNTCLQNKNTEDFRKNSKKCKKCEYEKSKNRVKEWRQNHKDELKEYLNNYYKSNKDKFKYKPEDYNERRKEYLKKWKQKNINKVKKYKKKYKKSEAGRLSHIASSHNRRIKQGGKLNKSVIQDIVKKSKNVCFWCGEKTKEYHIDHYMPIALGGDNNPNNLVFSCIRCNQTKHAKHPNQFLIELRSII